MSRKKRPRASDDDITYFVTNDMRMFDGRLDPGDQSILRGKQLITGDEALRLASEERATEAANTPVETPPQPTAIPAEQTPPHEGPLDPTDVRLTPETMNELGKNAVATLTNYESLASALITKLAIAPAVRRARIDDKCTWRAVARSMHDSLRKEHRLATELWEPSSNQLIGMALCKIAAQTYDQDFMEPPWN